MPRSVAGGDSATAAEHPSRGREVARVNRALSRIAPTRLRLGADAAPETRSRSSAAAVAALHELIAYVLTNCLAVRSSPSAYLVDLECREATEVFSV